MSNLVATAGHTKERALSLTTAEALVTLYQRRFGSTFPGEALQGFATALTNLANSLNETGDYSKAIVFAGDAARVWGVLVRDHPGVVEFRAHLATTQFVISNSCLALGKDAEAATAATESAVAFRSLYLSDNESYAFRLGSALISLGRARRSQRLHHEAASALKEAIGVYQAISPPIPPPILHELGIAISDFCETLAAWEQERPDLVEMIRCEYRQCVHGQVAGSADR